MANNTGGNWFGRHKILTTLVVIVILVIVGVSIGGGNKPTVNTAGTSTNQSASKKQSNSNNSPAHVGSTISIGGSKGLAVTLLKVVDPATGADQFTTPDAGKRFVALELQIKNNGSASYQDDANSNVTLIGNDNQSYTADFSSVSECTNFSNGQYTLAAGESSTGCVVFQVPNGVNTAKVQFQTESGFSGSTGEWLVP